MLAAFLVLILFMQFELIRSLATVDQATRISGRWLLCLRRPSQRRFEVPTIEYFLTEMEAHKSYFDKQRSRQSSVTNWGQVPFSIRPHAASLFSMQVPSPPRLFAMVLERQLVMASLSYLVYKAGAMIANQVKLAHSTNKSLADDNNDKKVELPPKKQPQPDFANEQDATAWYDVLRMLRDVIVMLLFVTALENNLAGTLLMCILSVHATSSDPSIDHERRDHILSKLLSSHQTVCPLLSQ